MAVSDSCPPRTALYSAVQCVVQVLLSDPAAPPPRPSHLWTALHAQLYNTVYRTVG